MTEGVIWRQLMNFSIPTAIGLLFQQLYNTVDTIVVGKFVGKEALAAVGSTGSIVNMLVGLCAGISVGAGVVISQHYGAKEYGRLRNALHTTVIITAILSVIATACGILLAKPLLGLMNTPEDVMGQAYTYLTIYFAGLSGLLIYNMGSGVLRAVGDSRRPLYFLCISALLNVIFDLLFVIAFGMGVAGVAYATIISQFVSAALVLFSLSGGNKPYSINWRELSVASGELKEIVRIGVPSGVQQAITSFSNVFVQSYINFYGTACMAGWSSYSKLDIFILIPMQSIAIASTTFVGQNYGAGKLGRAKDGVRQTLVFSLIVTAFLCVLMIIFRVPLLMLFNDDPEVIDFGARFIAMISPFYLLLCFNQIFAGALRGIGISRTPTMIMLFSFVLFRQLYLFVNRLLGQYFVLTALAYPAGWLACSILMSLAYLRSPLVKHSNQDASEELLAGDTTAN
jgi:putative MATE family efflux protein